MGEPITSGMYLHRATGDLVAMTEQGYPTEDVFQALLARHPQLLAGEQIDPARPRRWVLVTRELGVPDSEDATGTRWSLDLLLLDQDAIPTLVECKRSKDGRIRREVVGQLLEYAANTKAHRSMESIRADFEQTCREAGKDPNQELRDLLGDEPDAVDFWQRVETNLRAGRIRLLIVANRVPRELVQIVEFLNDHLTQVEVLVIEVPQYVGEGAQAIVPRLLGQRARSAQRRTRAWDRDSLVMEMRDRHGAESAQAATAMLDWAKANDWVVTWGAGSISGSFVLAFRHDDGLCRVARVSTDANLSIEFGRLKEWEAFRPEAPRHELRRRFNEAAGASLGEEAIERFLPVPLAAFHEQGSRDAFFQILRWVRDAVSRSPGGAAS